MPRSFNLFLLLLVVVCTAPVRAQVSASSSRPLLLSGYATADGAEHELDVGHALGGGGGIIVQHSRWLALDFRGVILRARVPLHTYILEAGPRIDRRYGRLEFYGEAMGGLGHSGYRISPKLLGKAYGATWTLDAGLDVRVKYGFSWRAAEYSYNRIYAGTGAKPAILSTGFKYSF